MNIKLPLENREQAGQALADALMEYADQDVVVLALPRGGVPVAFEVAQRLGATLDILLVRKLGTPGQQELAAGAIASGGVRIINDEVVQAVGITDAALDRVIAQETLELERRERLYRGDRAWPQIAGRTVILVDDGIATGSTMRAAIAALRGMQPRQVVVAVPLGAADTIAVLESEADRVVCLATPTPFFAIGPWYRDFAQVGDDDVRRLLSATESK
jgi:putative phosphoribosyl transferase